MSRGAQGWRSAWFLLAALAFGAAVYAATPGIPAPRDIPYPGTVGLTVDASDVQRRIMQVHETLPVRPGRLTLLYPQWLPGKHAARGQLDQLAGLVMTANGKPLAWQRDPVNVYAFHVQVPAGVTELELRFQVATPQAPDNDNIIPTAEMLGVQWNRTVLYPAGYYARGIRVATRLRLPPQWAHASALTVTATGDEVQFETVSLEDLVDSPLFAGRNHVQLDLAPGQKVPVRLNVFADSAKDLQVTPEQLQVHRAMVRESALAFGPTPFDRYDFLLALSDNFGGIGLEHSRSSENSQDPGYFTSWDDAVGDRDLLPHEFTHAWNGKYRRPADLWTAQYNVPMQNSLLWVYEGMTEYYGMVLSARSGLWTPEFARDTFAVVAAVYDRRRPGRAWRSLADTTNQPIINPRRPQSWVSWQRTEDYYTESVFLWLDVDARLRELSRGARSLDDAAQRFFAVPPNQGRISTYVLADLTGALNSAGGAGAADWRDFLERRVNLVNAPLLDGLTRAGWRLVYNDKPNATIRDSEKSRKVTDLSYSLGATTNSAGLLTEVVWDGPAFKAGLTNNTTLVAVNSRAFSGELLKEAVTQAKSGGEPIELLVRNQDRYRTVRIDYRGGLLYPHLEQIPGANDALSAILKPRR
ncbi:MAG: hypothetical protein ABI859_01075 [Pseudomonadota bacterium]